MVEPYKPLYTVKEVALILHINQATVYALMNAGRMTYLKIGSGNGTRRIRGSDLERFIETYPAEIAGAGDKTAE